MSWRTATPLYAVQVAQAAGARLCRYDGESSSLLFRPCKTVQIQFGNLGRQLQQIKHPRILGRPRQQPRRASEDCTGGKKRNGTRPGQGPALEL